MVCFALGGVYAAYNPFEMEPKKDDPAKLKRENEQLKKQVESLKKQIADLRKRIEAKSPPQAGRQAQPPCQFPWRPGQLQRRGAPPRQQPGVDREWFRRALEQKKMFRRFEGFRDGIGRLNAAQRQKIFEMLKQKMGPEKAKEFLKRLDAMLSAKHPPARGEGVHRPQQQPEPRKQPQPDLREMLKKHLWELLKKLQEERHPFGPDNEDQPRWF